MVLHIRKQISHMSIVQHIEKSLLEGRRKSPVVFFKIGTSCWPLLALVIARAHLHIRWFNKEGWKYICRLALHITVKYTLEICNCFFLNLKTKTNLVFVNLVRGRDCFVGLSIVLVYSCYLPIGNSVFNWLSIKNVSYKLDVLVLCNQLYWESNLEM